jgi:hypothetical protein
MALAALTLLASRDAEDRALNLKIALVIALEGLAVGAVEGLQLLAPTEANASIFKVLGVSAYFALIAAYPWLVFSLDVPFRRFFQSRLVGAALVVAFLGLEIPLLLWPTLYMSGSFLRVDGSYYAVNNPGFHLLITLTGIGLTGLLVLLGRAYARAPPGSASRATLRGMFWTFVVRDVLWILYFLFLWPSRQDGFEARTLWIAPLITATFGLVLTYWALEGSILDFRRFLSSASVRSLVFGAYLLVFLVTQQVVQAFFAQALGFVAGAVATGLMLFAFRPIERFADRMASRTIGPADDVTYLDRRKHDFYERAYATAYRELPIPPRRLARLDGFRKRLGLSAEEALAIELKAEALLARKAREALDAGSAFEQP